jgi:hypothetical protein
MKKTMTKGSLVSPSLSHVAVLVPSAKGAAAVCKASEWELGPVEDFPSEGTREVYVGRPANDALLLLMEAIGPGPYRNALEKRGPGLHHVAVNVASLDDYTASLAGSGWLLHPASLHTLAHRKTVYLARPGLGALIEVQQPGKRDASKRRQRFISEVFIEGDREHQRLLDALRVPGLRLAGKEGAGLVIGGRRMALAELIRG